MYDCADDFGKWEILRKTLIINNLDYRIWIKEWIDEGVKRQDFASSA